MNIKLKGGPWVSQGFKVGNNVYLLQALTTREFQGFPGEIPLPEL